MKFERFTVKAREAISDAQNMAGKMGNPEIRPQHLLLVLLTQEKGVAPSILSQIGVDVPGLSRAAAKLVDELPKVSGGAQAGLARSFQAALDSADKEARALGDSHVSTELFLVGLCDAADKAKQLLLDYGVTRERVLNAIQVIRKGQKVNGEESEQQLDALKKYARDMTAMARSPRRWRSFRRPGPRSARGCSCCAGSGLAGSAGSRRRGPPPGRACLPAPSRSCPARTS